MTKLTVYTLPTCSFCKKVKEFFDKEKIEYKEVDVSESPEAQEKIAELTGQIGVPVITKGDEIVVGYDLPKLRKLIA